MGTGSKVLFINIGQLGETQLFKSFIDAYCETTGLARTDVLVLLKSSTVELARLLFVPEGITCHFIDIESCQAALQGDQSAVEYLRETAARVRQSGEIRTVIHFGCSVFQPWAEAVFDLVRSLPAPERVYFQFFMGDSGQRQALLDRARELLACATYTAVYGIEGSETPGVAVHQLTLFDRMLDCLFPRHALPKLSPVRLPEQAPSGLPGPFALLSVGAGDSRRRYPPDSWAEVCLRVLQSGLHIVMIGSGDRDRADQSRIVELLGYKGGDVERVHALVDQLTLSESLHLVRQAAFTLSNDTGVANLAHAMRARLLVITWPYGLRTYFPYPPSSDSPTTRVLWCQPDCGPCGLHRFYGCEFFCVEHYPCIASVSPQDILSSVADWMVAAPGA